MVLGLVAALALTGCGIRSTAVPVDAGLPASRTACPPTPGASNGPEQPAAPSFLVPASASPSAWLALIPGLDATAPPGEAASAASAAQQTTAPSPTPSASQSTESLDSCLSLSPSADGSQAP
ncbi:hypothetical protein [Streptacidiphilus sp. MAP5-52]|uniref:hypothetical protein n=1 Tax=Streptacidiphilus sp. MAP5-52 TaxID=3156267 RepID=UPI003518FD32